MRIQFVQMFRNKYFQKFLIVSFLIFSSVSFAVRPAQANPFQVIGAMLLPGVWGMKTINYVKEEAINKTLDIVRTTFNIILTSTTDVPLAYFSGRNGDEVSACYILAADVYDPTTAEYNPDWDRSAPLTTAFAEGDPDHLQVVQEAIETIVQSEDGNVCNFNSNHVLTDPSAAFNRGTGSFLAVTSTIGDSTLNEPLPVNMASFTKHYARKIPILRNTAYAQVDNNIMGQELVYTLWTITRNIALALMSLILLVIGVMIMTRRKINPQAVVTVQNALPRVAMGIALIFFSFPIGALFAALVVPLSGSVIDLFFSLSAAALASVSNQALANLNLSAGTVMGSLNVIVITVVGMLYTISAGIFSTLAAIVVLIVAVVLLFICYIKAVFIYIKILMNIVFAPIQFALGVLPGKESSTMDWFKDMIANVISVPAMFLMIALAFFIMWASFISNVFQVTADPGSQIGRVFVLLFTPMIAMFCLITAMKIPGKIQKMVMGDKKR